MVNLQVLPSVTWFILTEGSERRDWPVIRALWLLLLSYKVGTVAKNAGHSKYFLLLAVKA